MSYEDMKTVVEPERIITYGDWVEGIIYDVLYGEDPDLEAEFLALFEIVGDKFMGDPDESFYQGIDWTTVIRRKSDQRLFGYTYWRPVAKHGDDAYLEENGEEFGLQPPYDEDHYCPIYVWFPVEEFSITGYKIIKPEVVAS